MMQVRPDTPDPTVPALQLATLVARDAIVDELHRSADLVAPDDGTSPDPAGVRAALVRASVLLLDLARWAGAVP